FESAGESLFFTSDTVLFPFFMEQKDLRTSLDISPELANSSKSKIFDLVTKKKALMLAQHFDPFPSLGHVLETEVGWKWKPIAVSNT
ncbi:MAG: hypothetical protein OEQ53_08360, partial [Saprospiraceae bacterium]|nr:hypothetical protein [Saprospiraceae bacterium]